MTTKILLIRPIVTRVNVGSGACRLLHHPYHKHNRPRQLIMTILQPLTCLHQNDHYFYPWQLLLQPLSVSMVMKKEGMNEIRARLINTYGENSIFITRCAAQSTAFGLNIKELLLA